MVERALVGTFSALMLCACQLGEGNGATMLPDPDAPFTLPPLQTTVEQYELVVPEQTLKLFADDVDAPEQPAVFVHDGKRHDILLRLRGNSSRYWPKRSWRVEFVDNKFEGRKKVNLISEWMDGTMMVEKLGFDLLAAMHAPSPVAKYVRLVINGHYEGVYLDAERVDKDFLDAHRFFDDDASIYRCGRKDCEMKPWRAAFQSNWQKKTNEHEGRQELDTILERITFTPEPDLASVLGQRIELELYLRTMVMDALISNNTTEDSRSYFIHDRISGRWIYVPWDLNNSALRWTPGSNVGGRPRIDRPMFGFSVTDSWVQARYEERVITHPEIAWHPISSNLNTRIAMNPELRARLVVLLERAQRELFQADVFGARVDAIHALLRPHMADDPYMSIEKFDDAPRYLKDYNAARVEFIQAELARLTAPPTLVISALDPHQQRVALKNLGASPIELRNLVLVTNVRSTTFSPNLPARTLGPGESIDLEAKALGLTFSSKGELALFDPTRVTPLDVLFYGEIPSGTVYARGEADPLRWELADQDD